MYQVVGELSGSTEVTSVSSSGFFDNLINDLKVWVNNKLMKFTYHIKLGVAETLLAQINKKGPGNIRNMDIWAKWDSIWKKAI